MYSDKQSFWTGIFAGVAFSFLLTTVILAILLSQSIGIQGGAVSLSAPSAQAGKMPPPQAPAKINETNQDYRGQANAPVTITEYADFFCHFCKKSHATTKQVLQNYAGRVKYVFKNFPLSGTPGQGSYVAHEASLCAKEQGKYWPYFDAVFEYPTNPTQADLEKIAQEKGLNLTKFKDCLSSGRTRPTITAEIAEARGKNISGTPIFFVNHVRIDGAEDYAKFQTVIDGVLKDGAKYVDPGAKPEPRAPQGPAAAVKFTDLKGRPSLGPENAQITLVEYSDFHCPFCKRIEPTIDQVMQTYAGKVRKVWRHYPLPFHKGADRTHEASECAHEQGKFWEFHKQILDATVRDDAAFAKIATDIKLDKNKFDQCLASGKYKAVVQSDMSSGSKNGVDGTPAVFVNGWLISGAQPFSSFQKIIDGVLKDGDKYKPEGAGAAPAAPQPPAIVKFEDLKGRPSEGPENAPVTLVEFSDYHCPFCGRVEPTIDKLMETYKGKIRKVWRHYPLPFHKGADRTHAAAECAHEQGKFWDYHKKLFASLGLNKDDATLIKFAEELKLDKGKFEQCLTSNKYIPLVQQEIAKGAQYGVRGTPATFVNGELVSGAQPYENFEKVVKKYLDGK